LLGDVEVRAGEIVIADLEAGVGTLARAAPGQIDVLVVVTDAAASAVGVARRLLARAPDVGIDRTVLVANKVLDDADVTAITGRLGRAPDVVVPDDRAIAAADRDGASPVDHDPDSPGVVAVTALAHTLIGVTAR
jgi:CO dehydrogenase nickel-insertion accessory protein CooC1